MRELKKQVCYILIVTILLVIAVPISIPVYAQGQTENPKQIHEGSIDGFDLSKSGLKIVFYTMHTSKLQIIDSDGSNLREISLPSELSVYRGVRWSPDENSIFFSGLNDTSSYGLWKIEVDGSGLTKIMDNVGFFDPSPDGNKIAYTPETSSLEESFGDLWVMGADGTNSRKIASPSSTILDIDWSPDGQKIAFLRSSMFTSEMWIVNADGTDLKIFYSNETIPFWTLSWLPDGTKIAFSTSVVNFQPTGGIWTISPDGSNLTRLTITDEMQRQPQFFPNASKIAYSTNSGIYVLDLMLDGLGSFNEVILDISFESSTTYVGFKVGINAKLTCNHVDISNARILLEYSVNSGETWNVITEGTTTTDIGYSAVWIPSATGEYLVRASWVVTGMHLGVSAIRSLAVTPFDDQYVFSFSSNSTVSALSFNSTSRVLSATVSGPSGTMGYAEVTIAKDLVANIADIKVYLEENQINYTATHTDSSWLLYFSYHHSTRNIMVSLSSSSGGETPAIAIYSIAVAAVIIAVIVIAAVVLKKRGK
jgi:Tol biopolymer transport system component